MHSDLSQSEGFSRANLYHIKRWFSCYSSQIVFVCQAGGQIQKVDNANTPVPEILLCVPWRLQTLLVPKHELSELGKGDLLFQRSSETLEDIVRQAGDFLRFQQFKIKAPCQFWGQRPQNWKSQIELTHIDEIRTLKTLSISCC